jgi:hypothetical protein
LTPRVNTICASLKNSALRLTPAASTAYGAQNFGAMVQGIQPHPWPSERFAVRHSRWENPVPPLLATERIAHHGRRPINFCSNRRGGAVENMPMARKTVIVHVNDKMQRGYTYVLMARSGRNFDPAFRPELTPKEMLALDVFCGKYMTDCAATNSPRAGLRGRGSRRQVAIAR